MTRPSCFCPYLSGIKTRVMKTKENTIKIISAALIILWIYAAASKWADFPAFKSQLSKQALIADYANFFVWFLPTIEIVAALLLMFALSRRAGMLLSFSLMTVFTGYIGLVAFGFIKKSSCICGGVLSQLGFKEHFWFNFFFLALAGIGIWLTRHDAKHTWTFLTFRKVLFRPSTADE